MGNILPNYVVSTRFACMGRGNCGLDQFSFPFRSVFCFLAFSLFTTPKPSSVLLERVGVGLFSPASAF